MELNEALLKEIAEQIQSPENKIRISNDRDRFVMYQGQLKKITKKAIEREFESPETINQLVNRIVPINIMQKIVNKLAQTYRQAPIRRPKETDEQDQESIDLLAESMEVNSQGKIANRLYKLHKHTLWEPYLDDNGYPSLRTLASHQYTPISFNRKDKTKPDVIVKHLSWNKDLGSQRHAVWTDESHVVMDGEGAVIASEMLSMNNIDKVNPYGALPFIYISERDDGSLIPIPDDDLVTMQIVISLILTDLAFASKYQLWSLLVIEGGDGKTNIPLNPNSIINLPIGATLKAIKPSTDIDKGLSYVEALVGMLLTTKNLSVGDITGQLNASNAASGVAKLIDRSESTEDRQDQEEVFINAEKALFELVALKMLPVWIDSNLVHPDYVMKFEDDFGVTVIFKDPRPVMGDREIIEVEKMKLEEGFTTKKNAMAELYPELTGEQIDRLIAEIEKEKIARLKFFQDNMPAPSPNSFNQDEDMNEPETSDDQPE